MQDIDGKARPDRIASRRVMQTQRRLCRWGRERSLIVVHAGRLELARYLSTSAAYGEALSWTVAIAR